MSDRVERYKKRKKLLNEIKEKPFVCGMVDQAHIDKLLDQEIDSEKLDALDYSTDLSYSLHSDPAEVEALLSDLKGSFHKERLEQLLDETKSGIIASIAGPFGLGKLLSAYDKEGGNVTTVNNANEGVYAEDGDRYNRGEYTNTKNSGGKQFSGSGKNSAGANYTRSQMDESWMVTDAYTGQVRKADTTSPDHIESLSQHHKNGGFMQTSEKKADFATDDGNLALTERSINQSMSDSEKVEWQERVNTEGVSNKERFGIDEEKLKNQVQKGKATSESHLPTNTEKAHYYVKNSAITGVNEGVKMGAQQAFGVLIVEFFSCSFSEIKSAFDKGLEGDTLFKDVKIRLKRVARSLSSKWKDIIQGFSGGFIAGFISNLVTTLVNMFVTTAQRVVRMIREGILSLLKAMKLILFRPENMSFQEVMHESMKLIAAGGITVVGVLLEEVVDKFISGIPFLAPFSTMVTAVVVGALTAISMALVTYLIDKMDLFNVIAVEQNKYVLKSLDNGINESVSRCMDISAEIDCLEYV